MKSQNREVLDHLKAGGRITNKVAFNNYSITRLSARIHDLRNQGYPIAAEKIRRRSRRTGRLIAYNSYYLEE